MSAVDITSLRKRYGATVAVDGLDLRIDTGEIFGLLGPNGAGKTTTVEILEGYRRPDGGVVRVLGLDPMRDGRRLRPRVGVMLQVGGVYPGIKPLEALRLFAAYYDDPDDPERLLDLVELRDAAGTVFRRLSGGQQQRLALALALVGRPELAFLDEPTAGMDPHARATTWSVIRDLRARGATVVLTTHAMDEAENLCDRVAIIDHGRLIALGAPRELASASGVATDTRFTGPIGLDVGALAVGLGLPPEAVREEAAGEYVVDAQGTPALIADLAGWLRDHGAVLGDLRAGRRSLEEVFLKLTAPGDHG